MQRLVALGRMPDEEDDPAEATVDAYESVLIALDLPLTDEEAAALLDVFPDGDYGSMYEVEWTLLHAIETAPFGPEFLGQLDDRSWWVSRMRQRAERDGLL